VIGIKEIGAPSFDDYKFNFQQLIVDLLEAEKALPEVYREACSRPFINFLTQRLGEGEFHFIFSSPPIDERSAMVQALVPDVAMAILQHNQSEYNVQESIAFRRIVRDLYASFVNNGKALGAFSPPGVSLPPLVVWGGGECGPYTHPAESVYHVGSRVGIVSLPHAYSKTGLASWVALGHETLGHDLCRAYPSLITELTDKVTSAVHNQFKIISLTRHWEKRVDEATADVCGVLSMGPMAALGLISYFRALTPDGKLKMCVGREDPHPVGVLRGLIAARVVSKLSFSLASIWSEIIRKQVEADLLGRSFQIVEERCGAHFPFPVDMASAMLSADVVADAMVDSKLDALGGHSLREIQNWTNHDQKIVDFIGPLMSKGRTLPETFPTFEYNAIHVLSAAMQESFKHFANVQLLFNSMIRTLGKIDKNGGSGKEMGQTLPSPVWGITNRYFSFMQKGA
jgi:hypothetical protein